MSNVLVYSGPGVSASALSHTLRTLRRLLPSYDVQCIGAKSLAVDPWAESTSLFVLPGGRDLPYVDSLAHGYSLASVNSRPRHADVPATARADQRIRQYVVEHGGAFIGICAGAYYASAACEFERGNPEMQIVGSRHALQFYPGTCSGTVFPGFVYESDQGARMVEVALPDKREPEYSAYYNGGGAFIDAERYKSAGVEVLGRYVEEKEAKYTGSDVAQHGIRPAYVGQAAVVRCTAGKGQAILYGTHPEFPVGRLERPAQQSGAPEVQPETATAWKATEARRIWHFGQHLRMLGLEVRLPEDARSIEDARHSSSPSSSPAPPAFEAGPPRPTPILLVARRPEAAQAILASLRQCVTGTDTLANATLFGTPSDGLLLSLCDTNDTVHFFDASHVGTALADACARGDYTPYMAPVVAPTSDEARAGQTSEPEMEVNLDKVPKYIVVVAQVGDEKRLDPRLAPHWDTALFAHSIDTSRELVAAAVQEQWVTAAFLSSSQRMSEDGERGGVQQPRLADIHTYGHVVTSTQTMLDKNYRLLTHLPFGFTSFATHQVSGRGRGKNTWISPLGCLQFSTLLRVPTPQRTFWYAGMGAIVFVQYLAGLAIVESVRSGALGPEYAAALGDKLRIKWPNDVYAHIDERTTGQELQRVSLSSAKLPARKATFIWRGKTYAKMAGVLVNSQFANGELALVVGCGINTLNPRPTTSLSDLVEAYNATLSESQLRLPAVSQERFAGAILATLERMWYTFVESGGNFAPFIDAYRRAWLHSDQETLLNDTVPPMRARIVGITSDFGLLRCVPLEDMATTAHTPIDSHDPASWGPSSVPGQWIDLQPDGNSFDMLQNLIRRKQ